MERGRERDCEYKTGRNGRIEEDKKIGERNWRKCWNKGMTGR